MISHSVGSGATTGSPVPHPVSSISASAAAWRGFVRACLMRASPGLENFKLLEASGIQLFSGVHRLEEFLVGLGLVHLVDQEFHCFDCVQLRQQLAQY